MMIDILKLVFFVLVLDLANIFEREEEGEIRLSIFSVYQSARWELRPIFENLHEVLNIVCIIVGEKNEEFQRESLSWHLIRVLLNLLNTADCQY